MATARHRRVEFAWWPVLLPMALVLASEYKLRSRPANQSIGGGVDATILIEVAVYGMVALYLYRRFGLGPPRRRPPVVLLLGWSFAVYSMLSALWTPFPVFGLVRGVQLLITAAVCQVVATRAGREDLHRLAHAFTVLVLISVGIGVAMPFPRTPQTVDRFNWLYVHPVSAGIFLGIALLLMLAFALPGALPRRWPPLAYVGAIVVLGAALIATGTRGAAAGCAVGAIVLMVVARGARGRAEFLLLGAPLVIVVVLAFPDDLVAFATRGETVQQLETLNARTDLWTLALEAVSQQPFFGNGLSAARGLFLDEIGLGGGHNAFVNALVEGGLVGLTLFCLLLVVLCTQHLRLGRLRAQRADAGLLLGLVLFFVIDGVTTEMAAAPANVASVWLYMVIAWTAILERRSSGDVVPAAVPAARFR
ncbi:O-antigen ligase family protein [Microbispora sp. NPDC049125]|uniref:O-antigen ligase family protein n=1 Tax=Microbispora sp. NPDC049125 TaxID=3154929 RepID=UPI0034678E2C